MLYKSAPEGQNIGRKQQSPYYSAPEERNISPRWSLEIFWCSFSTNIMPLCGNV